MWPFARSQKTETAAQPAQLIARADGADEQRSLANPEPWLFELFGAAPSLAGVSVTPTNAMRSPAVRAAVEAIAEAIGGLPLFIYRRDGDARTRAPEHSAYALLHDDANDWTSATSFREQITRDALLWGNGYAFINRDHDNKPVELIRLQPSAVTVELDRITREPTYKLSDGTRQQVYDRRQILHIAAPSIDGVSGASPIMQCREAIAVNMSIERHVARLFANHGRPSEAIVLPNKFTPEALAKVKASWRSMIETGMPAFLEEGTDYKQLTFTSADAQTLELWQHSVNEIARVFGVSPALLQDYDRQTFNNAEHGGQFFLTFCLARWIKVWQGEVRLKLIAPEDRATHYAEFLTDDLLRADFATRATAYAQYRAMGAMTANEVRAGLNLPPRPGGDVLQNPYTTTTTTKIAPAGSKADD